jgi:hypothetical protein
MGSYRLCIIRPGHPNRSVSCSLADDMDALEAARSLSTGRSGGRAVEVYRAGDLVARVKPNDAPLDISDATSL